MDFRKSKRQAEKTSGKRKKQAASGIEKTAENKEKIVQFVTLRGEAKTPEIADEVGLSQPRVRALLAELIAEGKIEPKGEGKARVYTPKK